MDRRSIRRMCRRRFYIRSIQKDYLTGSISTISHRNKKRNSPNASLKRIEGGRGTERDREIENDRGMANKARDLIVLLVGLHHERKALLAIDTGQTANHLNNSSSHEHVHLYLDLISLNSRPLLALNVTSVDLLAPQANADRHLTAVMPRQRMLLQPHDQLQIYLNVQVPTTLNGQDRVLCPAMQEVLPIPQTCVKRSSVFAIPQEIYDPRMPATRRDPGVENQTQREDRRTL